MNARACWMAFNVADIKIQNSAIGTEFGGIQAEMARGYWRIRKKLYPSHARTTLTIHQFTCSRPRHARPKIIFSCFSKRAINTTHTTKMAMLIAAGSA